MGSFYINDALAIIVPDKKIVDSIHEPLEQTPIIVCNNQTLPEFNNQVIKTIEQYKKKKIREARDEINAINSMCVKRNGDTLGTPCLNDQIILEYLRLRAYDGFLLIDEFDRQFHEEPDLNSMPLEIYNRDLIEVRKKGLSSPNDLENESDVRWGYAIDIVSKREIVTSGFGRHNEKAKRDLVSIISAVEGTLTPEKEDSRIMEGVIYFLNSHIRTPVVSLSIKSTVDPITSDISPSERAMEISRYLRSQRKLIPLSSLGQPLF
jgi:hypothetical protein